MPKFSFVKEVDIDRDKFFAISTDYEKFTEILPDYFKEKQIDERKEKVKKRIGDIVYRWRNGHSNVR